jgi:TRAP-type C4-dicarboxylate transport system substrate-binding protein
VKKKGLLLVFSSIFLGLALAVLPFMMACAPEAPAGPVELKMSHFMSEKHPMHAKLMAPFAEEVEQATDGRVTITIYSGGALGKPPDQYDSAVTGITDIAFGLQGYTPGKFPLTSVLELPAMVDIAATGSRVLWGLYEKFPEIRDEYPGVKVLTIWTHDTGQIMTTKKPIRTMDDLKGMTIRAPTASHVAMVEAWGATAVQMPISELYDSLAKGVADGCVVPYSAIKSFNLADVCQYITVGDFYVCTFFLVMNLDSWDKISSKDQKIIEGLIGSRMSETAGAAYDAAGKVGLQTAQEAGLDIYELPAGELAKWREALAPLYQQWIADIEAKGLPGQKIYDEAVKLAK